MCLRTDSTGEPTLWCAVRFFCVFPRLFVYVYSRFCDLISTVLYRCCTVVSVGVFGSKGLPHLMLSTLLMVIIIYYNNIKMR